MGYKSSILFVLLLASSPVYSAALSEQVIPLAPENSALFAGAHPQSDGDHVEFFAVSLLVIAALSFVRRTNNSRAPVKTNGRSQRAMSYGNPEAEINLS